MFVALFGVLAVAGGVFEFPLATAAGVVFVPVLAFSVRQLRQRVRGTREEGTFASFADPLLWTACVWMVFRFLLHYSPHAVLVPAGFIAWLAVSHPPGVCVVVFLVVSSMEGALLALGHQTLLNFCLNLASYGAVAAALVFFTGSRVYLDGRRKAVIRTKRAAAQHEYAEDLGFNENASAMRGVSELTAPWPSEKERLPVVEMVDEAFSLQLEILRHTLKLTTVVLFWPDPEQREFRLRSLASACADILPGPFPVGFGITGVLTGARDEFVQAPVPGSYPPLPYYKKKGDVGGIAAIRVPVEEGTGTGRIGNEGKRITPILCVDRSAAQPWSPEELEILRLAARKIAMEVRMGRQLLIMSQERSAIHLLCLGMHELNGALGLEQVFSATIRALKRLAQPDFIAITLVQGNSHRIGAVEGDRAEKLCGMEFPLDDGLAGQAIKIRHSLPAKAQCHGPTQVFGGGHALTGYESLLIIPLLKREGEGIGSLTVASRNKAAFDGSSQDMLELIASQVAIKIDLGQAHEQISKLATIDGLTGLANHRTFQRGFDIMLQRAERRKGSLCLVLCDIDHFKKVNDTYGHPFGDKVLQGVSEVLLKAVRSLDLAARYGGEEFAIVLEDADEKGGCLMVERIRQEIERKIFLHEREPVQVTVSLGLAVYPGHGQDKKTLVSLADQALYRAKQQGRNRLVCWGA